MSRRGGFTLIELMVALVVTGVVALLAYATAHAGLETNERLDRHRGSAETQVIVRALLIGALRHLPEGGGAAMDDVLFSLDDRTSAAGLPSDRVEFLSRGLGPSGGTSAMWAVSLAPEDDGVRLRAAPIQPGSMLPLDALLPDVRGLDVRVLSRGADGTWTDRWDQPGRTPAAVAIEFLSAAGDAAGPGLVVDAALENVR